MNLSWKIKKLKGKAMNPKCVDCPFHKKVMEELAELLKICRGGQRQAVPQDATEPTISTYETETPVHD
jgi:hypothetical protein